MFTTTAVEVVVLSVLDGSGTCLSVVGHDDSERVLGKMHVVGSCTQSLSDLTGSRSPDIVVYVRFSERYMAFFGHRYLTFCYPGLRRRSLFYASGIKVQSEVLAVLSCSEDGGR